MTMTSIAGLLTGLATGLIPQIMVGAPTIHIAFHNGTTTAGGMTNRPAGTFVNTAAQQWNNVINNSGVGLAFTNLALRDAGGASNGATLTCLSGYSGYNTNGWGSQSQDWVMMEGWYGIMGAEFVAISNLPAAFLAEGYTVRIFGDCNEFSRDMSYTVGGYTKTIYDRGTFAGGFAAATNYVEFTGLTGPVVHITGNSGGKRSAINGLQIIAGGGPPSPAILDFRASRAYVAPDAGVTLTWQVTNAAALTLTPGPGDVAGLTTNGLGAWPTAPATTTTYTLTASNASGTVSRSVRVGVGPTRPNILVFLVDDMGWQDTSVPFLYSNGVPVVTARNQEYRTPNMEALAARGVRFTSAYAQPVCSPTRVSLMTGRDAARHRVTNWTTPTGSESSGTTANLLPPNNWRTNGIAATEITLPRLLAGAGYRTIHCGKGHFGSVGAHGQYPQNIGFDINIAGSEIGHPASYYGTNSFGTGSNHVPGLDQYHGSNIFLTDALTIEMSKAMEQSVADGAPFFAYMAHYAVHSPFQADGRFAANYPGLSGSELNYATLLEGMDRSLGELLQTLERIGAAENTLVVFASDNGGDNPRSPPSPPLRGKKGMLYEGGIRVPMIAAWARTNAANAFQAACLIPAGSAHHGIVHVRDLFPTVLARGGVAWSHAIDATDLSPMLRDPAASVRPQSLLIHFPHQRDNGTWSQNPGTAYREGPWKLIYNYHSAGVELYNLESDPAETTNLSASEPVRVQQLARRMAREVAGMAAPLPISRATSQPVGPIMPAAAGVDSDLDGLTDEAEDPNRNGLLDPGETDPDRADTDGDGMNDAQEKRAGTDPNNPASRLAVIFQPHAGTVPTVLSWPSHTNALYRVESAGEMPPVLWRVLADDLPGAPGQTDYALPAGETTASRRYFRIVLK